MMQLPASTDIELQRSQGEMKQLTEQVRGLHESGRFDAAKAKEVSEQFEAMLVRQMLKAMTDTLENDGFLGDMPGGDFYGEMFLNEISMSMARRGDFGLSKQLLEQIEDRGDLNPEQTVRSLSERDRVRLTEAVRPQVERAVAAQPVGATLSARLQHYEPIIVEAANAYSLDPQLIKAVIAQESYGNAAAESHVGAKGLMQLMDATAAGLGVTDSFDPRQNVMGGARYLREMLDRYGGDLTLALAAYNAGPGNVDKYDGVPPFDETQRYVRRVQDYYTSFQ